MVHSSKKKFFLLSLLVAGNVCFANIDEEGIQQFNPNEARFQAAPKWDDATAALVYGGSGALFGAVGVGVVNKNIQGVVGGAIIVGAITGSIGVYRNGQYNNAYDIAGGRNIHGAAAANNSAGSHAWVAHYGEAHAIKQLGSDKLTPLMVAAGNGAEQAVQAIGDVMPAEYEVVESVIETETEELRTSFGYARPEVAKVKSKAVKKRRVKTNTMQDASGKTALHWAYDGKHWHLARILISKGKADGMVADNCGRTIKDMTINGKSLADVVNNPCKNGFSR